MNKRTIFLALMSLLFTAASIGLLVGLIWWVGNSNKKLDERRIEAVQQAAQEAELTVLGRLVEETTVERAHLESLIMTEDAVIDLLALLTGLGEEQGVVITTTSLDKTPGQGTFENLSVGLLVEGPYESVMHMLKLFETLPYQSALTHITLSKDDVSGDWSGKVQLNFTKFK